MHMNAIVCTIVIAEVLVVGIGDADDTSRVRFADDDAKPRRPMRNYSARIVSTGLSPSKGQAWSTPVIKPIAWTNAFQVSRCLASTRRPSAVKV
jgi:hypothetical protein